MKDATTDSLVLEPTACSATSRTDVATASEPHDSADETTATFERSNDGWAEHTIPEDAMLTAANVVNPAARAEDVPAIRLFEPDRSHSDHSDPMIGRTLHGFRIERPLGEGSMARVYLASHLTLERQYAVKVLHPDRAARPDLVARLRREARLLSRVRHPNVVEVHDFGVTEEGRPFVAIELLSGATLRELLNREQRLPPLKAAAIARQIALGLAAAHQVGLIHRDLKPDNVMIIEDPVDHHLDVKVLDFGLARLTSTAGVPGQLGGEDLTRAHDLIGTPRYMAPEQILNPTSVSGSADLYALGVILYEMIAGRPPFPGQNVPELINQQLAHAPPPLFSGATGLEWLIDRLLEKNPALRPASAQAVVQQLDLLVPAEAASRPGPRARTSRPPPPNPAAAELARQERRSSAPPPPPASRPDSRLESRLRGIVIASLFLAASVLGVLLAVVLLDRSDVEIPAFEKPRPAAHSKAEIP